MSLIFMILLKKGKFVLKVIALASERGISAVVSSACKVMGMRALKTGRIGTAMGWALRSQVRSNVIFRTSRWKNATLNIFYRTYISLRSLPTSF